MLKKLGLFVFLMLVSRCAMPAWAQIPSAYFTIACKGVLQDRGPAFTEGLVSVHITLQNGVVDRTLACTAGATDETVTVPMAIHTVGNPVVSITSSTTATYGISGGRGGTTLTTAHCNEFTDNGSLRNKCDAHVVPIEGTVITNVWVPDNWSSGIR